MSWFLLTYSWMTKNPAACRVREKPEASWHSRLTRNIPYALCSNKPEQEHLYKPLIWITAGTTLRDAVIGKEIITNELTLLTNQIWEFNSTRVSSPKDYELSLVIYETLFNPNTWCIFIKLFTWDRGCSPSYFIFSHQSGIYRWFKDHRTTE